MSRVAQPSASDKACRDSFSIVETDAVYLTITSTAPDATDMGYLLHKHPERAQQFDVSAGVAHVFYPEAGDQRCTVALLLEVDPVALVRYASTILTLQPVSESLGLQAVRQLAWAGNFDGKNWQSTAFVGMTDRQDCGSAHTGRQPGFGSRRRRHGRRAQPRGRRRRHDLRLDRGRRLPRMDGGQGPTGRRGAPRLITKA